MRAVAASKNANLSDVTISKKLIIEENDHAVKTRIPGTWGDEARYVWLRKENIMDIHNGKTILTFLDSNKDYKLYDSQNRVVTTQKGTELYTHYDKVELKMALLIERSSKLSHGWDTIQRSKQFLKAFMIETEYRKPGQILSMQSKNF